MLGPVKRLCYDQSWLRGLTQAPRALVGGAALAERGVPAAWRLRGCGLTHRRQEESDCALCVDSGLLGTTAEFEQCFLLESDPGKQNRRERSARSLVAGEGARLSLHREARLLLRCPLIYKGLSLLFPPASSTLSAPS